jgi:hypothetical protein
VDVESYEIATMCSSIADGFTRILVPKHFAAPHRHVSPHLASMSAIFPAYSDQRILQLSKQTIPPERYVARKLKGASLSRTIANFCRTSSACNRASSDPTGNCVVTRRSNPARTASMGPCKPSPSGGGGVAQPATASRGRAAQTGVDLIAADLTLPVSCTRRPGTIESRMGRCITTIRQTRTHDN